MLWATGCVLCLVAVVRCAAVCEGLFALFFWLWALGGGMVGVVGGHEVLFFGKKETGTGREERGR